MGSDWGRGSRWETRALPNDLPWFIKLALPSSVKVQVAMPGRNPPFGNRRRDPWAAGPIFGGLTVRPERDRCTKYPPTQRSTSGYCDFHGHFRNSRRCPRCHDGQQCFGSWNGFPNVRVVCPLPSWEDTDGWIALCGIDAETLPMLGLPSPTLRYHTRHVETSGRRNVRCGLGNPTHQWLSS